MGIARNSEAGVDAELEIRGLLGLTLALCAPRAGDLVVPALALGRELEAEKRASTPPPRPTPDPPSGLAVTRGHLPVPGFGCMSCALEKLEGPRAQEVLGRPP